MTNKRDKSKTIEKYRSHEKDTGSSEVQIALFTERINYLNNHFRLFKKDEASKMGLIKLVGKRRKLLRYLKDNNEKKYQEVTSSLGLRK